MPPLVIIIELAAAAPYAVSCSPPRTKQFLPPVTDMYIG